MEWQVPKHLKDKLDETCGPHCGIDGFSASTRVGHCPGCHTGSCEANDYDRDEVHAQRLTEEEKRFIAPYLKVHPDNATGAEWMRAKRLMEADQNER